MIGIQRSWLPTLLHYPFGMNDGRTPIAYGMGYYHCYSWRVDYGTEFRIRSGEIAQYPKRRDLAVHVCREWSHGPASEVQPSGKVMEMAQLIMGMAHIITGMNHLILSLRPESRRTVIAPCSEVRGVVRANMSLSNSYYIPTWGQHLLGIASIASSLVFPSVDL